MTGTRYVSSWLDQLSSKFLGQEQFEVGDMESFIENGDIHTNQWVWSHLMNNVV